MDESFSEAATKPYVLLLLSGVVIVILFVYYRICYAPYQVFKDMGVEGPNPRLFFGNITEYKKMGEEKLFEHLYHTYGPICGFYLGSEPHLLVTDLNVVKQIMVKEFDCFTDREELPFNAVKVPRVPPPLRDMVGEEWRRARSIFASVFIPSKLKLMVPLFEGSREVLVNNFEKAALSGGSIDVWKQFQSFALEVLWSSFGQHANEDEGQLLKGSVVAFFESFRSARRGEGIHKNIDIISHLPIAKRLWKHYSKRVRAKEELKTITKVMLKLVEVCRQEQEESQSTLRKRDFLMMFVELSKSSDGQRAISNEEVVSYCVTLLLAGYENLASTLTFTSYLLALNPRVQEKLCTQIDLFYKGNPGASTFGAAGGLVYLNKVVQESLRLYCSVPKIGRQCVKTCTIGSLTIPEGTKVVIPVDLIHHLPVYWKDPEQFRPERFSSVEKARRPDLCHMPFGEGPRSCIAMRFALMEVKMTLVSILRKYKFGKAPETQIPLQTEFGISRTPRDTVCLKIFKCRQAAGD